MLGFSYDGSRRVDFVASIENIRVAPIAGENATLLAESPDATPYVEVNVSNANVRYDSAGAIAGKAKGTVFNEAKVTYVLQLSDPLVRNSARHIDDALNHRERTFPSFLAKSVPGAGAEPLHRLVNTAQQQANRDAAAATCKDVWNTYDGTKLNCDEYPFSSTVEGAAKGDRRYSARLIPSADNQKAGSMLNSTFTANRVLDGDAFSVSVTA